MPFDGTDYQELPAVTKMLMDGRKRVQYGWCQHIMRQRGSVCMIGALTTLTVTDSRLPALAEQLHLAEQMLLGAINELGYPHTSVVAFNDDLSRTKEEVLAVYDRAIP